MTSCAPADAKERGTAYTLETVVSCAKGGDSERFKQGGWGEAEASFTWTKKTRAGLKLSLAPVKGPLGLRMRLEGKISPPDVPAQLVEVSVNGHRVAGWLVEAPDDFFAIIPSEVLRQDGKLHVTLQIPAAQPLVPASPDEPRLGVACHEFEVSKAASRPRFEGEPLVRPLER